MDIIIIALLNLQFIGMQRKQQSPMPQTKKRKQQSPMPQTKKRLINNKQINQLYQQFVLLKQHLSTNTNNSKYKHNSSKKKKRNTVNDNNYQSKNSKNQSQQQQQYQKQLNNHKNDNDKHLMIMNTPQPSKNHKNKYNIDNTSSDQSQSFNNKPHQQQLAIKQSHKSNRFHLIQQYTQLYQYSIKKIINKNNNKKYISKHQSNQRSSNKQKNNIQQQPKLIIGKKLNFHLNQKQVNHNNQHFISQSNTIQSSIDDIQKIFNPFQQTINTIINDHQQKLSSINSNLTKIKSIIQNSKIQKNQQKQNIEKGLHYPNNDKDSSKIFTGNDKSIHIQQMQFDQFNQHYTPDDDTNSICSQTLQQQQLND